MQINTEKMQATMALVLLCDYRDGRMLAVEDMEQITLWLNKLGDSENEISHYFDMDDSVIKHCLKILEDYINKVAP